MSDMFDHKADAWDQRIQLESSGQPIGEGYPAYKARINSQYGKLGNRIREPNVQFCELSVEEQQPEYQQFNVEGIHAETQKSWMVSGTIYFDPPYWGFDKFNFEKIWLPKSRCEASGGKIRVPQWLVKNRFRDKNAGPKDHRRQFGSLMDKADSLIGKTVTIVCDTAKVEDAMGRVQKHPMIINTAIFTDGFESDPYGEEYDPPF